MLWLLCLKYPPFEVDSKDTACKTKVYIYSISAFVVAVRGTYYIDQGL